MKYNITMRRAYIFLFLGIWVAILPYLGFPHSWKNILFTISGLGIIYFSFILYGEYKGKEKQVKTFDNFSENNNFGEKEKGGEEKSEEK